MPKLTRAPSHQRYSNPLQLPTTLPPATAMSYYAPRPTMATYYEVQAPGPQANMALPPFESYGVPPLAIPQAGNTVGGPVGGAPLLTHHRASSGAWTAQDDQTLVNARAAGQNWSQIQANYFPGKTGNACRKRHERLMERKGADDWDTRKLERLCKDYMTMRKEIWQPLAQRTGEKWNVVEQKVIHSQHHPARDDGCLTRLCYSACPTVSRTSNHTHEHLPAESELKPVYRQDMTTIAVSVVSV